jgi:flagellar biosynthetic protein FliR
VSRVELLPLAPFLEAEAIAFILVMTRLSCLFLFAPILSSDAVPRLVRVFGCLAMTLILMPNLPGRSFRPNNMVDLALGVGAELVIGMVLVFTLQVVFQGFQLAGQVTGTQIGLSLGAVLNPQFDDQSTSASVIYGTLGGLIFLAIGGHREVTRALLVSLGELPPGTWIATDSIDTALLAVLAESTAFAIRVAAPVIVTLLLTELATGFVGRTVPQLNMLTVSVTIRVLVGVMMTTAALSSAGDAFLNAMGSATFAAADGFARLISGH